MMRRERFVTVFTTTLRHYVGHPLDDPRLARTSVATQADIIARVHTGARTQTRITSHPALPAVCRPPSGRSASPPPLQHHFRSESWRVLTTLSCGRLRTASPVIVAVGMLKFSMRVPLLSYPFDIEPTYISIFPSERSTFSATIERFEISVS